MFKEPHLIKILRKEGFILRGKPLLISNNGFAWIYHCKSDVGEVILKISPKYGMTEKIPGLGGNHLEKEFLFDCFQIKNRVVPKIIKFGEFRSGISYLYIIYKKISGDNLAKLIDERKISFFSLKAIYRNIGKEIKIIHRKKFIGFGDINNSSKLGVEVKAGDWYAFFSKVLGNCLNKIKKGYFAKDFFVLEKYVERGLLNIKNTKVIPTLLHGDLEPWNIIVRGERVVGIIDGEFAFSGHNLIDLAIEYPSYLDKREKQILQRQLFRGYFGSRNISDRETKCLNFYNNIKILTHRMVCWNYFVKLINKKQRIVEEERIKEKLEDYEE